LGACGETEFEGRAGRFSGLAVTRRKRGSIARKAATNKALKKKSFTGRYESDILFASVAAVKDAARQQKK
jgi:hypothetical protein